MKELLQNYINNLSKSSFYSITNINNIKDLDEIYAAVISSKFRKSKILLDDEFDIKNKLKEFINQKTPIEFSIPFGAYKSWKLATNFVPEWAEVFHLSYLVQYAASILKVYPYGINFTYTYSDDIMYFVSDIPKNKIKQYLLDFYQLLQIFNQIDERIKFNIIKINDLYDSNECYYMDFLDCFLDNLVFWDSKYNIETKNRHIKSAHNNLYPFGEKQINKQPKEIQEKYYYYSALMTDAVDCLKERRKFNKDQKRIQLVGVKGPSKSINIGACETSTVHFWVGRGCMSINKRKLKPFVYTSSNWIKLKEEGKIEEYFIESIFSSINNNYKKIEFIL